MKLFTPTDGPYWLKRFADSILAAFKQVMDAPFRLWASDAAALPPPSDYEGGLAWTSDAKQVAYSDGAAWQRLLASDPTLEALAAFDANGLVAQTAPDSFAGRAIVGPAAGLTVTNGDGAAGNPAIALANDLAALEGLTGTGLARRTGSDAWSVGGAVSAAEGGTGNASYAIGDLLYASATNALSRLPDVASGSLLLSGGVGAAPAWGKAGLTSHVSGVLPAANGGTGNAAYTVGDLLYASTTSTLARLAGAVVGNVLISGGVGAAPAWGKVSMNSHVTGTLPANNGGTGVTSSTGGGGSVVLSNGPTLTGTLTGAAANFTGNVTLGQNFANAHVLNGTVTIGSVSTTPAARDNLTFLDSFGAVLDRKSIAWNASGTGVVAKMSLIFETANSMGIVFSHFFNGGVTTTTDVFRISVSGIGYPTGTGGAVTQPTSKSTGVTLNKVCGQITMNAAALAANSSVAFTLANSNIAATDLVLVAIASGATSLAYLIAVQAMAAGSCSIVLRNVSAGSLAEPVVINFAVMKAVSS